MVFLNKTPIIDLTDDQVVEIIDNTTEVNSTAILRTLIDNGLSEPMVLPVDSSPVSSVTRSKQTRRSLDDINVVKIVKKTSNSAISNVKRVQKVSQSAKEIVTIPSDPPPVNFSDKKCPICFDALKNPSVTLCGHVFCTECLQAAVRTSKQCPICRKKMTLKGFHPLYL